MFNIKSKAKLPRNMLSCFTAGHINAVLLVINNIDPNIPTLILYGKHSTIVKFMRDNSKDGKENVFSIETNAYEFPTISIRVQVNETFLKFEQVLK
jgi:hypothetical protein